MRGLVLANTLVYRTPQTLDQLLLVAGILIIEPLVLWVLTNKVRFPKLILVSLTANIASSVVGTIVGSFTVFGTSMGPYLPFLLLIPPINLANFLGNSIFILVAFLLSVLIEWRVYKPFKIPHSLKAAFIANSASYLLIIIYIFIIAFWFPEQYISPFALQGKNGIGSINRAQQAYHFEIQIFADGVNVTSATNELGIVIFSDYYDFSIEGTEKVAYSFALPKNPEHDLPSYSGAISFEAETRQYSSIICEVSFIGAGTVKPILVNGVFTCGENMKMLK